MDITPERDHLEDRNLLAGLTGTYGAENALRQYIDSAHLDVEYTDALIEKIISDAAERARKMLVQTVWGQMTPPGETENGVDPKYAHGWDDATSEAVDLIKGACLNICGKCRTPIEYVEHVLGNNWFHEERSHDDHTPFPAPLVP